MALFSALPAPRTQANWLSKLAGGAEQALVRTPGRGARALDGAAAHIKTLPPIPGTTALAAQATPEGHWRFVNKAGETLTAGTPDEMKRVVPLLVPDAKPDVRLALYLTEDTLFAQRAALKDLPRGTELHLLAGGESYRILRRGEGAAERLYAEVRSNLAVELRDHKAFAETLWQLARPLNKANIRILALEPAGPSRLTPAPRIDPTTNRALIDSIDPARLTAAFGTVRGQTVLVTGRIEGTLLYFKPSSGPERSLIVDDLFKAAETADVNLIVLHSASTPRQPGGRNWLWQKIEVKGLDAALQRARVADFYNALAAPNARLAVSATPAGPLRTILEVRPAPDLPKVPASRPIGDILVDAVSDLTGRVITSSVQASVRSAERQQEMDLRLVPGIPSHLQMGYAGLLLAGLLGLPVARTWWSRIWPPEDPSEYAGRPGYWAARAVRGAAFVAVFLPLTAPASAPFSVALQMWGLVTAPVRWSKWLIAKFARRSAPAEGEAVAPASGTEPQGAIDTAPDLGGYRPSR